MYLTRDSILKLLEKKDLVIRPLLDNNQINQISIDLRLGSDFFVSIQGRDAYINASHNNGDYGDIGLFFQETRRKIGETFILHPHQTVLASSLEYIKLPNNLVAILSIRSTYARLGLVLNSVIQPGYAGCFSLELTNNNKNPINLTIGACLFQIRLVSVESSQEYFSEEKKYIAQVRPFIPIIKNDPDLKILNMIWERDKK